MDVDCDNFSQIREFITQKQLIAKAAYISFDLEFTGVKYDNNQRDKPFYLPNEKYLKMRQVAKKYNIIQIGMTFFVHNPNTIEAYPFNFYVFPRESSFSDPVVSLQAGCVEFNTNQEMDWNRWIKKGITYMKMTDYEQIVEGIQANNKSSKLMLEYLDGENKLMAEEILATIEQFNAQNKNQVDDICILRVSAYPIKKVVDRYVEENHFNILIELNEQQLKDFERDYVTLVMKKISLEQKVRIVKAKEQKLFGFTLIWKQIWNSQATFIGHNCFYDLLFIYESFVASLPEFQPFKEAIQDKKIKFYDTKFIASLLNQDQEKFPKGTSLEEIYKSIKAELFQQTHLTLPQAFQRYDLDNPALHQAGFDSYLTGWVFYQFYKMNHNEDEKWKNKINLNFSYYHLDLSGKNDCVNEKAMIFCLQICPPNKFVKLDDLKKTRQMELKSLKELFKKKDILKSVSIFEGFKQIFIEVRWKNRVDVIKTLVGFVEDGMIKNLHSLQRYITGKIIKDSLQKKDE